MVRRSSAGGVGGIQKNRIQSLAVVLLRLYSVIQIPSNLSGIATSSAIESSQKLCF